MKITLFTFSFAFLLWGCGQEEQPPVPAPQVKEPPARVDLVKLQIRGDLVYLQNTEIPFTGEAKSHYKDGQLRAEALIKKGELKSLKRWWPNGAMELAMGFGKGTAPYRQPKSYEASSSFVLVPSPAVQNLKSVEREVHWTALIAKHTRGLYSQELRAKVVSRLAETPRHQAALLTPYLEESKNTELGASFSYRIETNASDGSPRLMIIARARSPEGARIVADLAQREYENFSQSDEKRKIEFARQTLESLLTKSIEEEKKVMNEIAGFKNAKGLPYLEDSQKALEDSKKLFASEMNGIKLELIRIRLQLRRILEIQGRARTSQKARSSQDPNQDVAVLKEFWAIDDIAKYRNLPALRKTLDELNRERMTFDDNLLRKHQGNISAAAQSDPGIIENARAILRQVQALKEETTAAVQSLQEKFRQLSSDEKEFALELNKLQMESVRIETFKESLLPYERKLETAKENTHEIYKRLNELKIEQALPGGQKEGLQKERVAELPSSPIPLQRPPSLEEALLSKNLSGGQTPWLPHGSFRNFHENGKKKMEGAYQEGRKMGTWVLYDQTGEEVGRKSFEGDESTVDRQTAATQTEAERTSRPQSSDD